MTAMSLHYGDWERSKARWLLAQRNRKFYKVKWEKKVQVIKEAPYPMLLLPDLRERIKTSTCECCKEPLSSENRDFLHDKGKGGNVVQRGERCYHVADYYADIPDGTLQMFRREEKCGVIDRNTGMNMKDRRDEVSNLLEGAALPGKGGSVIGLCGPSHCSH